MNSPFVLLAQGTTNPSQGAIPQATSTTQTVTSAPGGSKPPQPMWAEFFKSPLPMLALLMLVFFIFMQRQNKNKDKSRLDMLAQLKRGDRIQTIGGILGTVVEAREDEVVVKVDESSNTKLRFARNAIHKVLEAEKSGAK